MKAQKKLRAEELKEKGQALQAAGDHAKAVAAYDMGSDLVTTTYHCLSRTCCSGAVAAASMRDKLARRKLR